MMQHMFTFKFSKSLNMSMQDLSILGGECSNFFFIIYASNAYENTKE